jgi:O-antigen/teichoic acid export membrane protein
MGIAGIYLAQVAGNLLLILALLPYTVRNSKPAFNTAAWKDMMAYGFPLIIAAVATVMLNVIDRYALNSLALLKFVAIYTLAFKISSSLKLVVVDTIKLAVFPRMIKRIDSPDNRRFYSKAMLYSSFAVMFAIIGVSLFSLEAIKLLSKTNELWTAWLLVPVLSIATFFMNMREVSVYGLIATKKTQKISTIVILSTLIGLGLNLLLIPLWNAMGAAISTLISQLFYWFLMHITAQRNYPIPYENRKLLMIFVTGSILSMAGLLFNDMDLLPRLVIKSLCLVSFPFVLYLMRFYEPVEIEAIRGFVRKWSDPGKLRDNIRSLKKIGNDM